VLNEAGITPKQKKEDSNKKEISSIVVVKKEEEQKAVPKESDLTLREPVAINTKIKEIPEKELRDLLNVQE